MVIPVDPHERILVHKRGPNVRSAPNVWSFPSGLHEHGESLEDAARREIMEEFNLKIEHLIQVGTYENQPGDGWHWVITLFIGSVENVEAYTNREPDKHPEVWTDHIGCILDKQFWSQFNQSLYDFAYRRRGLLLEYAGDLFEHV